MTSSAIDRQAFLLERTRGVGGSDIASVFGLGYGCTRRLWYEKRAIQADFPRETTPVMELGNILEPYFASKYAERTGHQVRTSGVLHHPDHPEMLVHVDRIITDPARGVNNEGVLEVKSLGVRPYLDAKRNGLPEDYILQLQHGMLVSGLGWGAFVVGCRDSGEVEHWEVARDESLCAAIESEVPMFWATVENGPAPEALSPDDRRCQSCEYRVTCQGGALMESRGDGDLEDGEDLRGLLVEYDETKALFCHELADGSKGTDADYLLEDVKGRICEALGRRLAVGCGMDGKVRKVYHRPQSRSSCDDKRMAADLGLARGKVDYDGTFLPERGLEARYRVAGRQFQVLRIY